MICTSVIPCLCSRLAKNNKITTMFVLFFPEFVAILKRLPFFGKRGDKPYTRTVTQDVLGQFVKGTLNSNNFSKKCGCFDQNLTADTFQQNICGKNCDFRTVFWGQM